VVSLFFFLAFASALEQSLALSRVQPPHKRGRFFFQQRLEYNTRLERVQRPKPSHCQSFGVTWPLSWVKNRTRASVKAQQPLDKRKFDQSACTDQESRLSKRKMSVSWVCFALGLSTTNLVCIHSLSLSLRSRRGERYQVTIKLMEINNRYRTQSSGTPHSSPPLLPSR
jgi:hypothetical protein